MTDRDEVLEALNAAKLALLKRIEKAGAIGGSTPSSVSELALAYRYLAGGPQPGGVVTEK
ncbi:hypothetical protein [Curtobacterium sp. MEB011]|uniref:hypothetical protein n=1 Tax=Curtobacterium sp. MEB011 TaxID=3040285 RepID=UPI00254F0443|nr:hypothetical protein [Curtobacterium sp. MEB011]